MVHHALREVLDSEYRGPRAMFTEVDVLKALLEIGRSGNVGRGRLGIVISLGQGEVRTLIKRLKDRQLITIQADGCRLSKRGEREYSKLSSLLVSSGPVPAKSLNLGRECWAVLVRGAANAVRYGIEQRDAAIKAGADGAFTAVFISGRFMIPGESVDCESDGPREPWVMLRGKGPVEGDVAIVTGSSTSRASEDGALAAMLTLV